MPHYYYVTFAYDFRIISTPNRRTVGCWVGSCQNWDEFIVKLRLLSLSRFRSLGCWVHGPSAQHAQITRAPVYCTVVVASLCAKSCVSYALSNNICNVIDLHILHACIAGEIQSLYAHSRSILYANLAKPKRCFFFFASSGEREQRNARKSSVIFSLHICVSLSAQQPASGSSNSIPNEPNIEKEGVDYANRDGVAASGINWKK